MNMVRHDAPFDRAISLAAKMQQCLLDSSGAGRLTKHAAAVTLIEPGFDACMPFIAGNGVSVKPLQQLPGKAPLPSEK